MNIEAFSWYAGSTGLLTAAEGTELKIAFADRAAVEFAVRKGLVSGTWAPGNLFTFAGFGKDGRALLEALLTNPELRKATAARFPNATQFHVKSAWKFVQGWKAPGSEEPGAL